MRVTVHVWACACVGVCMCGRVHVWACACVGVCMCGRVHVWACACVGACMCGRVHVWAHAIHVLFATILWWDIFHKKCPVVMYIITSYKTQ